MRKTLYLKFCLAYIIFGLFGFILVATFVSNMIGDHLKKDEADSLYKEATLIADTYATDLYDNKTSLDTVKTQFDALSTYLNANIWIINPSGLMVVDSSSPINLSKDVYVKNFDPTVTAGSYYITGKFFDYFNGIRFFKRRYERTYCFGLFHTLNPKQPLTNFITFNFNLVLR